MKILIIGGSGNISTPITAELVEKGHQVTVFNRGNQEMPGVRTIRGDRTRHSEFETAMASEGTWDCVIDMVGYEVADAESAVRAFSGRIGRFVFCSTVDVYTKPAPSYPVREDAERKPSEDFQYAYKKAGMENVFMSASESGKLPLTIIRPAATYNDGWAPISLIGPGNYVLKRIRQGLPIIVLGDGTSLWVSSHRDDVAKAFVGAVGNPKTIGKQYTVSGDEFISWLTYYGIVAEEMGMPGISAVGIPAELLAKALPKSAEWCRINFCYSNAYDNSAAKEDLGYEYKVTWREGVRRILAFHDERGLIDNAPDYPAYDAVLQSFGKLGYQMVEDLRGLDK